jgi:RHS repeat-associated protein
VFDLASNGGGLLTFDYQKDGYLPVQRKNNVPWRDFTWLPDVVMIPADSQTTAMRLLSSGTQVARGSVVSDKSGTRQATLYVPPGTQATLILPGGATQTLTTFHVHITEYTAGDTGPQAMPGELPPPVGYTYAVDYSMDEAVAAGALNVSFSQPLIHYSEDFLGFPVGMNVPTGYYDRVMGEWFASPNGKVIKIVSITDGLADLDTTGTGVIDNGVALGVTDAERQTLGALYSSGQTLWRVPVSHFSPWDYNWPYGPPGDATAPNQPPPGDPPLPYPCPQGGSIIGCEPQTLGEAVAIAGTPFRLSYSSQRALGRKDSLVIPLSGSTIPASLKRIDLEVQVAGQVYTSTFAPATNLKTSYNWDHKDAYGRTLQGSQPIKVTIGYVYDAVYRTPAQNNQAFANFGDAMTAVGARSEIIIWQVWNGKIGRWVSRTLGLGGWELDVHHAYSPSDGVLYLGDGNLAGGGARASSIITTVAGTGIAGYNGSDVPGADDMPAAQAQLNSPEGVAVRPDGSLDIADSYNHRIRRVGPDGMIKTVAGKGSCDYNGDWKSAFGGLCYPSGVAVAPDGYSYIADAGNDRVRAVEPPGEYWIEGVAGTGTGGYNGDGISARQAQLNDPNGVALGPDGSLYIADTWNHRIRRVDPYNQQDDYRLDNIITTAAGTGTYGYNGDGIPARQAQLNVPYGVAVGPDGSLYIADTYNQRIRRVGPDGIITTVAGTGAGGYNGDGIPATQAQLNYPNGVAVGPDGSLYIADTNNHRIRLVGTDGIIRTVAGTGTQGYNGDGIPALQSQLSAPRGVAVGPDGILYIADTGNQRIRQVKGPRPGFGAADLLIPSDDGSEVYHFSGSGRHLRTLDALTGAVRYQFSYDSAGRLTQVTDGDGNVTTSEHDGNGNPTAIVAPYGQRTALQVDANGSLSSITAPGNLVTRLTSTSDGLLTKLTDPRGGVHTFTYDSQGRLTRDNDPAGGYKTLARTDASQSYQVTVGSALNRTTNYQVTNLPAGGMTRAVTLPSGLQNQWTINTDASTQGRSADGTTFANTLSPDPIWHMLVPFPSTIAITSPLGLTTSIATNRTATLSNPADLLSLATRNDTISLNGDSFTSNYDGASRTFTEMTPQGRVSTRTTDVQGRLTSGQIGGVYAVSYTYDSHGRLSTITQGTGPDTRTYTFTYNASGDLATITDPLGRVVSLAYDAAGRVISQTLPGNRVVGYSYDANDNITSITPPGRTAHTFTYTPVDLVASYLPPNAGTAITPTTYAYNLDQQLTSVTRPDGQVVTLGYDSAGRQNAMTTPGGTITYGYSSTNGNLTTINAPGGIDLSYSYDGSLVTGQTWSEPVAGSTSRTYDNSLRVSSTLVNGTNPIALQYDHDSLLVQAGTLTLSRDGQNGLVTGIALGSLTDTRAYNGFAERVSYDASYNGTSVYNVQYSRDLLGRITAITETIGGATNTYGYTYDVAGRLAQVTENGATISSYTYDGNGNRLSFTGSGDTLNGTYDDQDRLTTYGLTSYTYTANGELASKMASGQTTTFQYDALGNLTAVSLPGGPQIAYIVDGQNHRIGKKVNGTLVKGWLYDDDLRPIAELDGSNAVVSRFVYASWSNVPDYMIKGGVTYRILTDHLGSPRLMVNTATGAIAQQMDYDEFGQVVNDTNPGFQPFGFAGGLYDPDTKLVRFGVRDYDAATGRWTAKDPIGFLGGDANLYNYVRNAPVSRRDPKGLDWTPSPWDSTLGGFAAAAMAATEVTIVLSEDATIVAAAGTLPAGWILGGSAGTATAISAAGAVVGAGLAGYGIGTVIDYGITQALGKPLGVAIYDWLHPTPCP